jgi:hypothetical protein
MHAEPTPATRLQRKSVVLGLWLSLLLALIISFSFEPAAIRLSAFFAGLFPLAALLGICDPASARD